MNLLKLNLWQGGIFKQAKYLISTPQRSQNVIYISETGTISREVLPMFSGYITAAETHMSWLVYHLLKINVKNKNGEQEDNQVLTISERSYLPLDPFNRLSKKDVITPLKDIAKMRHAEERANISDSNNEDARTRLMRIATTGFLILIGLEVVLKLWLGRGG